MDTNFQFENVPGSPDWSTVAHYLKTATPGPELDAYIDALTEYALDHQSELNSSLDLPILGYALELAQNPLTCRSVALTIAVTASSQDYQAVDTLVAGYHRSREQSFLSAALLEALGLLALHNPLARAEATTALLRLVSDDTSYLLIKGLQLIGRLDNRQRAPELRTKLHELSQTDDLSVASEAYYQEALIVLTDALLASDMGQLREQLVAARASFACAEATAEIRPDAHIYVLLIDMILALEQLTRDQQQTADQLTVLASDLHAQLSQVLTQLWPGYGTPVVAIMSIRCLSVADALQNAVLTIAGAEDWTNLDAALIDLATILVLAHAEHGTSYGNERLNAALDAIINEVLIPKLGPVLERAVTRRRLSRIIDNYRIKHGDDAIVQKLQALQKVLVELDVQGRSVQDKSIENHMHDLLRSTDPKFRDAIQHLLGIVMHGNTFPISLASETRLPVISIDNPKLYGGDPVVDVTVRRSLKDAYDRLGSYPSPQWRRFQVVLEKVVAFIQYIRDEIPDYTLCSEDGGKGLSASEHDLQADVFKMLRMEFGRGASYEHSRIGGGRPDTGIGFQEVFFPIEIKHEFKSIDRQHIRNSYLTQADLYAAATDRIAFLLVLDLREVNSAGHRHRSRARRHDSDTSKILSLYRLEQSFWVDGLPTDLQVANTTPNVVVVGLVPGNRSRPSSATIYSQRPKS